ncbi:cysteine proteinase [Wallemia mellicola]|nr:cysteine proteinase [Wallemia mellicola]
MVRKRESIKQKVKEVFNASPPSENVEEAVDDSLEDDLFAQLDAKDDAEQESQPQESQPASKSHSNRSETELEQKKTRKAKREEKRLQEEESIRQAAFKEANLPENEKLAKEATEEEKIIIDICAKHKRKMFEISPDGHCLYAAIADQINCDNLLGYSHEKQSNYSDMRKIAANYLRQHVDDFMPFLSTANLSPADGADANGNEAEGLPMDTKQYEQYCEIIEKTGEWGGHIEVRFTVLFCFRANHMKLLAISRAINKPIHVVQRSYPNVILIGGNEGEFENNPESVDGIWLTFHTRMYGLGEHYNSLRRKEDTTD